jgi:hypothetical protein
MLHVRNTIRTVAEVVIELEIRKFKERQLLLPIKSQASTRDNSVAYSLFSKSLPLQHFDDKMANTKTIFKHPREWSLYKDMTAAAWRVAILACLGAMVFGYDTAWWSGVLGMPAFTSRYGTYNPVTKKYALSSSLTSSGKSRESYNQ